MVNGAPTVPILKILLSLSGVLLQPFALCLLLGFAHFSRSKFLEMVCWAMCVIFSGENISCGSKFE